MSPVPSSEYLEVPGGRIAYDVAGPEKSSALVLLHEGIADRRMWDPAFSQLAQRYRVVRYDQRGFGASPPAETEFSAVEDLKVLVDQLDLRRPLLVGASMGGRIALDFVVAYPGVVRGLLLVAPGFSGMDYPMFPDGAFKMDEKASKAAYDAFTAGKVEEAIEHLRGLWGAALSGNNLELFRTMVGENAAEVFLERSGQRERPVEPKAASRLSTLDVPVHILVGDRDNPAQPHIAGYLAEHIPRARLTIVPGADHLLNLTAPTAFDEAVEDAMRP